MDLSNGVFYQIIQSNSIYDNLQVIEMGIYYYFSFANLKAKIFILPDLKFHHISFHNIIEYFIKYI